MTKDTEAWIVVLVLAAIGILVALNTEPKHEYDEYESYPGEGCEGSINWMC